MADDTTTETATVTDVAAAAPAEKKTRAPRRPKAAVEANPVEAIATPSEPPAKKTRTKRGSKLAVVKAEKPAVEAKKKITRTPRAKAVVSEPPQAVEALDDIAVLIKLEEENKQLRKQLSDRLRAENADLRKRLGQA